MSAFVRIGGVAHHVVVQGHGPVCLLSGGLGQAWFDWDAVTRLLAPYRTVVRFDRPGLGLSAHARVAPSLLGEADRIGRVLDACGATGPVTVVGHSLAGLHCEAFARLRPERTAALVLVDSSVEEDARPRPAPALRAGATRACGTVLAASGLPYALGPALRRAAVRLARTGGRDPAPRDLVRRVYGTGRATRAVLAENAGYRDVAAQLVAVRRQFPLPEELPVTVLAAGESRRWLERQVWLARTLDARLRISPGSGHLVMLDRPEDVARAVLDAGTAQAEA
ncbi:putative aminoacrylate hydrolase RutD [Streptomyces sp. YIM 130001]|uniref:alpha/beta fold hydrolase n=1 Tax=Streptomyces sp. YIM 130001 TaxID=2259644 RepID=UPI000EE33EFD|nr:alpha/beta hydrolase [Streptomyces sp. YIM 130001]RII17073.1 putative aminoacrylate hydrolase RutD [Streptomyces sp. YIM 130001]